MSALLEIESVEVGYRPDFIPVVANVSFQVSQGTATMLVGRNGSGKSTFLRAIVGDPQVYCKGTVRFQGQVAVCNPHWWQRHGVLWIPQQEGAFEDLSVRENLALAAKWAGARTIDAALDLFPDLSRLLARKAKHLSGGERRMVELAVVTFLDLPAMLLADEPTAPLSSQNSIRFMTFVENLLDRGTAVIIATHNDEFASRKHQLLSFGVEV